MGEGESVELLVVMCLKVLRNTYVLVRICLVLGKNKSQRKSGD